MFVCCCTVMAFVVGGYGCTGTGGCRGLAVRGRRHRHVGVMHRSRMQQRAEVETGKEVDVAVEKEGQVSPTEMLIAALEVWRLERRSVWFNREGDS